MAWTQILKIALAIGAAALLVRQCRKPAGWPGRGIVTLMNRGHAGLTAWGLSHVTIERTFTMLDVGCGGGATVRRLAAAADLGKVYGVDYSRASVAASRATNADAIAQGRVDIQLGSVSRLPYSDAAFDLVTAVETHYYWPDLPSDVREIFRVLVPGGRLVIIAELYRRRRFDPGALVMKPLGGVTLSADEHRALLSAAGYSEIDVQTSTRGWICAIGRKPLASAERQRD